VAPTNNSAARIRYLTVLYIIERIVAMTKIPIDAIAFGYAKPIAITFKTILLSHIILRCLTS
jgi:hypothetical protein